MMNNIIILLLIVLVLSYFVFLYDLNNFIIEKFSVEANKCYAKNMDDIDVNMRDCTIYYTKNTSLCDQYPELFILSKNKLLNEINNPNNNPLNINLNGKSYTLEILTNVLNDKTKYNINSTCSFKPEGLYEIDNNLGNTNKYQKKIITNNIQSNNNYLYSCFLPLDASKITSNGLIDQYVIDSYNTENTQTPCVGDKKPVTNIKCHGVNCPPSDNFLPIDLNVVQRVNNAIIDIDDTLIFIKLKQSNYGIKSIIFDSFVKYNKINKVFEKVDNAYIKNIVNIKLFTFTYRNGKIYLSPKILTSDVFTFTFNDNNNIILYDILNNPFNDFSLKYLSINDIQVDNYYTSMSGFYDPVKRLAAYIQSKTNETTLDYEKINNYINEYNNIKTIEKEESIIRLNNEINYISETLIPANENKKNIEMAACPEDQILGCRQLYFNCTNNDSSRSDYCISTVLVPCRNCNRNNIMREYQNNLNSYNNILNMKNIMKNNIINTPVDTTVNIYNLETYQGIYDIINLSELAFNNVYINKFDDSLLSVDDNCIYVNIPV